MSRESGGVGLQVRAGRAVAKPKAVCCVTRRSGGRLGENPSCLGPSTCGSAQAFR